MASFVPSQTNICVGDCINFTDNSLGNNISTWNWTFSGGSPSSFSGQNPGSICFNTLGVNTVTLSVVNNFGIDDTTITINVTACNPPIADFTSNDNEICEGDCINFSDLSVEADSWNWVFAGGTPTYSTSQNPQNVCFNTNGVYTIELTATNSFGTDTKSSTIVVNQNPIISLGIDISINEGEEVTLIATGSSGMYNWLPEEIFSCLGCASQTFSPHNNTTIQVTVIDDNGCEANDKLNVYIEWEYEIFVPNAFTPFGDGLNDSFGPVCDFDIEDYQLVVFNRWGEAIFEGFNQKNGWDGKVNNQLVPAGVYVWRLVGKNSINFTNIRETGHVIVLY
ncbi:MAG: hypothetical protein A3K10_10145 [Bacteroidetes bacterium RIFCSPLOWO2_12_FULL_31_6]|nr:MAG: hypothetical protein A3K10_10145 [Bacteroidetes bacterium RIFCSPLOWO2_12_FULL_31_6]